jgi:hypothetical protein
MNTIRKIAVGLVTGTITLMLCAGVASAASVTDGAQVDPALTAAATTMAANLASVSNVCPTTSACPLSSVPFTTTHVVYEVAADEATAISEMGAPLGDTWSYGMGVEQITDNTVSPYLDGSVAVVVVFGQNAPAPVTTTTVPVVTVAPPVVAVVPVTPVTPVTTTTVPVTTTTVPVTTTTVPVTPVAPVKKAPVKKSPVKKAPVKTLTGTTPVVVGTVPTVTITHVVTPAVKTPKVSVTPKVVTSTQTPVPSFAASHSAGITFSGWELWLLLALLLLAIALYTGRLIERRKAHATN